MNRGAAGTRGNWVDRCLMSVVESDASGRFAAPVREPVVSTCAEYRCQSVSLMKRGVAPVLEAVCRRHKRLLRNGVIIHHVPLAAARPRFENRGYR